MAIKLPHSTLLACLSTALALSLPASAVADPSVTPSAPSPAPTETISSATSTTTSASTTPEVPAPMPPASSTSTTETVPTTTTPAPAGSNAPTGTVTSPTSTTPEVQAQHPQGSTLGGSPSTSGHGGHGGRKPTTPAANEGNEQETGSTGLLGVAGTRRRRAPSPSALTPPLPFTLGSSVGSVPDFFIESFRIPPFLLPIYQAAGTAYGIPWQVLAAINEVETDYGRDLSVSSAGAEGWMQFLPPEWAQYGVDANGDGFKDPYNPADAIFAAARYLKAAGGDSDIRSAIYSYNHSQAYVDSVLLRAKLLGGTPPDLLSSITGLTEARFPVHAPSRFSDGFPVADASSTNTPKTLVGTTIYTQDGAPVIAVQDGQILEIGDSPALGRYISMRDAYGNTYTYAQLGSIATLYPVLKPHERTTADSRIAQPGAPADPPPNGPASAGAQPRSPLSESAIGSGLALGAAASLEPSPTAAGAPGAPAIASTPAPASPSSSSTAHMFRAGPDDVYLHPLRTGVQVIAGTVLGHVGATAGASSSPTNGPATPGVLTPGSPAKGSAKPGSLAPGSPPSGSATPGSPAEGSATPGLATGDTQPHMLFQIRPAGVGAPLIDPKPILDGWVALERSSIFRAKGENPFLASSPTVGQVLLESKEQLEQQVLHNPAIDIYECGRQDIETGQIDRRVLATLEFLSVSGLRPTVSALKCGHSELTTEGNVSEHSTGDAVDIAAVNGIPIEGHQGAGSITDTTIRKLLTLQGTMKPHQIISLMSYPGAENTLALPDHYNHIHVGFRPLYAGGASIAGAFSSTSITPDQWIKLISRLGEIPDPTVNSGRSAAAIPDRPGAPSRSSPSTSTEAGESSGG
jgi:hypothetical protein